MAEKNSSAPLKTAQGAATLWCVHVTGADDVHPMPSREVALEEANALNTSICRIKRQDIDPVLIAVVAEWPHSADSHAAGLMIRDECLRMRATPALPATEDSSAGDLAHDTLRCAVGNCTFNGEVAQHAAGCQQSTQPTRAEVQAEPVALPDAAYTALQFVEGQLAAIANRQFQSADTIEPVDTIAKAAKRAKAALNRLQSVAHHFDTAPQAQPADALDAENAKLKKDYQELGNMFHDQIVAQQAAWIEWQHGAGAEAGMQWIENGLCGPGHIPDEDEPYGTEAQAYFDANKSDPFPTCYCGRPSNSLWMGKGFCSNAHYNEHRAAMAAAQEGGKA